MQRYAAALLCLFTTAHACAQSAQPDPARDDAAPPAPSGVLADPDAGASTIVTEPETWQFHSAAVYWENDGTYAKPFSQSDNHYTNGIKLDLAWRPVLPDRMVELLRGPDEFADADLAVGLVVAQHIYTGFDIKVRNPPADDRPWAGYLYAGLYVQRASDNVHDHLELDLGVVGQASGAEGTQKFIHSAFPEQARPLGWGNQLTNEFAANLRLARTWRSPVADVFGLDLQALPRVSGDVGNVFVRAHADVTVRLGLHLPDDFGPGRLLDYRDATGSWSSEHDFGFYLFARAGGRLVFHNIFLDGNTFQNSPRTDKEPFVGEMEFGFRLRYRWAELGWSVTWLTEEYERQDSPDAFGSWVLTVRF